MLPGAMLVVDRCYAIGPYNTRCYAIATNATRCYAISYDATPPGATLMVLMLPGAMLFCFATGSNCSGYNATRREAAGPYGNRCYANATTLPAAILLVPMLQDLIGPAVRKPSRLGAILSVYIITVTRGELR